MTSSTEQVITTSIPLSLGGGTITPRFRLVQLNQALKKVNVLKLQVYLSELAAIQTGLVPGDLYCDLEGNVKIIWPLTNLLLSLSSPRSFLLRIL